MQACYVWKCECGIEWKCLRNTEELKQTHVCLCARQHELNGVVAHLFYSTSFTQMLNEQWREVPPPEIKDHLIEA
jgi:hypothetical protein